MQAMVDHLLGDEKCLVGLQMSQASSLARHELVAKSLDILKFLTQPVDQRPFVSQSRPLLPCLWEGMKKESRQKRMLVDEHRLGCAVYHHRA